MDHKFRLSVGEKVKAKISGFTGLITSAAVHLNGCDRYFVEPQVDKDGKMREGYWFDDADLVVVSGQKRTRSNNDRGGFHSKIK